MNFQDYIATKEILNSQLDVLHDKLNSFPKSEIGLVEITDEYMIVKREWNMKFGMLRSLNQIANKKYKKEIYEYTMKKRFAHLNK